jgi:hypothetical protein
MILNQSAIERALEDSKRNEKLMASLAGNRGFTDAVKAGQEFAELAGNRGFTDAVKAGQKFAERNPKEFKRNPTLVSEAENLLASNHVISSLDTIQRNTSFLNEVVYRSPSNQLISGLDTIQRNTQTISSALDWVTSNRGLSVFDELRSNYSTLNNAFGLAISSNLFDSTFYKEFQEIYEDIGEEDADNVFESIWKAIEKRFGSFSDKIKFEKVRADILTIVVFLIGWQLSIISENNLKNEINQVKAHFNRQAELLLKKIDSLSIQNKKTYYIVLRHVNLRENPSTKSPIILVLNPNQRVLLIERKGKWIKVECFDHVNEKKMNGWVFKKYLQKEIKN